MLKKLIILSCGFITISTFAAESLLPSALLHRSIHFYIEYYYHNANDKKQDRIRKKAYKSAICAIEEAIGMPVEEYLQQHTPWSLDTVIDRIGVPAAQLKIVQELTKDQDREKFIKQKLQEAYQLYPDSDPE